MSVFWGNSVHVQLGGKAAGTSRLTAESVCFSLSYIHVMLKNPTHVNCKV